jgi:hypothetical protein
MRLNLPKGNKDETERKREGQVTKPCDYKMTTIGGKRLTFLVTL